ncbi:MAG: glycosyltransferase [bacterium]
MGLKILHIAPFNTAGVPITFVKAERRLGHHSRLITLSKDPRDYQEDLCLDLPFLNSWGTRLAKKLVSHPSKLNITNEKNTPDETPLAWHPNNLAEKCLISLREWLWRKRIDALFEEIDFWNFDVYQLDGGLEFFRNGRTVQRLKALGKKIICCYTGSDLRTRGVIPIIDSLSDLNITLEYDHLRLHPNIEHVFFPFDVTSYDIRPEPESNTITIGHAPTNRQAKGSQKIIAAVKDLESVYPVELKLIENLTHKEALREKSRCHIFVDQVGDLGYGINSLEALAMGIPTCSCLAPGFAEKYPNHPFVVIDEKNIKHQLIELIQNKELRQKKGLQGRKWVKQHHDSVKVVQRIHHLADILPITQQTVS